jgi:hypothetical protein
MRAAWLALGICLFVAGCKTTKTTWSAEARSPDGKYVARGRTDVQGGFGTDGLQTTVDLNWTTGSQSATNILTLPDGPYESERTSVLKMRWLTPTHLELTYTGSQTPLFQAVRSDGVDIT